MRRLLIVACSVFAVTLMGCPALSGLTLGGDPELVGTWEGTTEFLGHTIIAQVTYVSNGSYVGAMTVLTDHSTASMGGKWYADPDKGWLDVKREWTNPEMDNSLGTQKSLYEVSGDTIDLWGNPLNMPRPESRELAGNHFVYTRKRNKDVSMPANEVPGLCQELLQMMD